MPSTQFSVSSGLLRERSMRNKCVTVSILGVVIFCILLAYVSFSDGSNVENSSNSRLTYVIFRHGDRNPTETYRNDPYGDSKYWRGGWGALTNKGKLQMYKLGKFLKTRYRELLGEVYSPDRILIRSSDNDRCLMSAGALLAGLYPPSAEELWLPELHWQPIPIHATPRNLDKLIVVKKPCPLYDKTLKEAYKSEEILDADKENTALYQYLSSQTGQNISSVLDVEFLFNTLEIEDINGFQLPHWTSSVYPDKMKNIAKVSLAVFTHTLSLKRLVGGPLVNDIRSILTLKRDNKLKPDRSVFLISAHDITIVNVLRSLGFEDLFKPEIGATLMFELHSGSPELDTNDHYVKLIFLRTSAEITDPVSMQIPGCTDPCKLDTFLSLTSSIAVTPEQWEEECLL